MRYGVESSGMQFDHLAVAVADLSVAGPEWARLGFAVTPGGDHRGRGTSNVLIPFGSSYVELISITDHDEAMRAGREALIRRLRESGAGPVAYAFRGADFENVALGAQAAGLSTGSPVSVRRDAGGREAAAWRLLSPNQEHYGTWWPFFIEWEQGYPLPPADGHPNRVIGIDEVVVGVSDFDRARMFFESDFGIRPVQDHASSGSSARHVSYDLANSRLTLLANAPARQASPRDDGVLAIVVATQGAHLLPEAPDDPAAVVELPPAVSGLRLAGRSLT